MSRCLRSPPTKWTPKFPLPPPACSRTLTSPKEQRFRSIPSLELLLATVKLRSPRRPALLRAKLPRKRKRLHPQSLHRLLKLQNLRTKKRKKMRRVPRRSSAKWRASTILIWHRWKAAASVAALPSRTFWIFSKKKKQSQRQKMLPPLQARPARQRRVPRPRSNFPETLFRL